jgi:stage II sporulation protein D
MKTQRGRVRLLIAATAAAVSLSSAGLVTITAPAASAAQTYWVPPTGDLTVFGRGFGHGRGMSQYGAQGAALAGRTATQILSFYYPGTTTTAASGSMRVWISGDTTSGIMVMPSSGLRIRDLGDNAIWTLPVSSSVTRWSIEPYGDHRTRLLYFHAPSGRWIAFTGRSVFKGMAQFEGSAPKPLILPSGSTRLYRGTLRAADRSGASLDTINVLPLDDYVRGVVPREAITSWRPAALQAQSVAARTYSVAKRSAAARRDYDLCDTISCQVYGGCSAEVASTNAAVAATAGKIRTYRGRPILAEFSSSNGGYTAASSVSYQVAKSDPYDGYSGNRNRNHTWTATINRAVAQSALGVGTLKSIAVTKRTGLGVWGGRVLSVNVTGSGGTKTYTGDQVRRKLGLKSNWFNFENSAIIERWRAIGGASSGVGDVIGAEYAVRGGTGHSFAKGRIYHSSAGAWEVYGSIWNRYSAIGGPNHRIGLPVSPRVAGTKPNSVVQAYSGGRFFYAPQIRLAREVSGPIYYAYYRVSFERGRLGLPTSYEYSWSGGRRQVFEGGYIDYLSATKTTRVTYR